MRFIYCLIAFLAFACSQPTEGKKEFMNQPEKADYAFVIHGGAGTILKSKMDDRVEQQYLEKLTEALVAGENVLKKGGNSLDAVEAAICIMEDSPLFNAGKGAVFTNDGHNELDASFMDGKNQQAGAVGGVRYVKNPIKAARAVLEKSNHVMLTGKGADQFAKEQGLELVETSYFHTDRRKKSLEAAKQAENPVGTVLSEDDYKYGTVGAVALDKAGNLAAGTSTGGMTNKRYGRIGDSPIIGAGSYANNNTCAVSSTGHGEYFMRYLVAYDISALLEYADWSLEKAADHVINKKLKENGGGGGVIAVDKYGNIAMPFNTAGMYRASVKAGEPMKVLIYGGKN